MGGPHKNSKVGGVMIDLCFVYLLCFILISISIDIYEENHIFHPMCCEEKHIHHTVTHIISQNIFYHSYTSDDSCKHTAVQYKHWWSVCIL